MKLIHQLLLLVLIGTNYLQAMELPPANKASLAHILNANDEATPTEVTTTVAPFKDLANLAAIAASAESISDSQGKNPHKTLRVKRQRPYELTGGKQLTPSSYKRKQDDSQQVEQKQVTATIPSYTRFFCTYPECSGFFKNYDEIRNHICTHLNIMPYTCPALNCKKATTTKSNLSLHIKNKHKDKPGLKAADLSSETVEYIKQRIAPYIEEPKRANQWRLS